MFVAKSRFDRKLWIGVFLAAVFPASNGDCPRAAIERYFAGQALGNAGLMRESFAPDAKLEFVEGNEHRFWTREEFVKRFQDPAQDEFSRVRRVERLDANENTANAVLMLDYPQVVIHEQASLMKIGGNWKITKLMSSAEKRNRAQQAIQETLQERSLPFEPRRILGNIYYVGTNLISSFLIVTPAGHILLDTGQSQMLPQVEANITKLGFRVQDVKILLNSHAHFDHCGGFAEFKRQTGATVVASAADRELMLHGGGGDFFWGDDLPYEPIKPDRIVADGDQVELGGARLTALLTPGHTKGCTTWSMRTREGGIDYDVLFLCGLTVSPYKLANSQRYPHLVEDARNSILRLHRVHADVLLASHGFWFDLEGKAVRQKPGAPNPFIDQGELGRHLQEMQQDLEQAVQAQEQPHK